MFGVLFFAICQTCAMMQSQWMWSTVFGVMSMAFFVLMILARPVGSIVAEHAPLRSRFCRRCNTLVKRLDHHCVLANCCVGEGNHGFFFAFLCVEWVFLSLCTPVVGDMTVQMVKLWFRGAGESGLLVLWSCVVLAGLQISWFICLVRLAMDVHAASTNWTYIEFWDREKVDYLQGWSEEADSPFDAGFWQNWKEHLFGGRDYYQTW